MIRWDLLQPVDIGGNFQAGFQTGKEIVRRHKLQGALVAYSQDPTDPEAENALAALSPEFAMRLAGNRAHSAAESAERQRVGSYFVNPDRKAAKQQALESGDIDIAKQIDALGEDERKAAAGKYKAATPVAYQALKLKDPAQRQAYIQSVKPELVANGWSEQDIDGFDPSDANLNAILTTGMTLEQAMGRDKITYKEVGPGARLVPFDDTGRPVNGTGQPAPIDNPVSETAPPEAAPGSFDLGAAADLAKKFGTVTSTVRSPGA